MKKVMVYSTPTCPYCKMAKKFMDDNKVKYEDIDVVADEKKAEEMIAKSGQMGVPVIVIGEGKDEQVLIGFDQAKLSKALGIMAYFSGNR